MKKNFGKVLLASSVLLLAACSNEEPQTSASSSSESSSSTSITSSNSQTASSSTQESTTDSEGSTPAVELGTKENPAPLSQPVNFQTHYKDQNDATQPVMLSMTLKNITSGEEAYYQMHDLDPSNPNAPEGQEWLLFDVTFMMNTEDAAAQLTVENTFTLETSDGQNFEQAYTPNLAEQAFQSSLLTNGALISGKFALLHPIGDASTIVFNAPDGTTQLFWHL